MNRDDALFHGEIMFWVLALGLVVIGGFNSYLLPVWANVVIGSSVLLCTSTARKLKESRLREDA